MNIKPDDRVGMQNKEFDALDKLVQARDSLYATSVVDDDYLEVRWHYEHALEDFVRAMGNNGRFPKGNKYGLEAV